MLTCTHTHKHTHRRTNRNTHAHKDTSKVPRSKNLSEPLILFATLKFSAKSPLDRSHCRRSVKEAAGGGGGGPGGVVLSVVGQKMCLG